MVPIGALAITYCVVWNWSDDVLKKAEILEFAGQFLAFCGAFCLGYFIFANEQVKRREKQSEDISLLKDIMYNADIDLINLRNASESGKSDKELKGKIGLITTEKDWRRYYREYEHLYGKNSELKIALGIYFDRIDKINLLINEGMYIEANDFNQRCINDDLYNTMDYNPSGLLLELESDRKIWYKQKNTKKQILYICDKYADIIEILIYNYLIINGLERCDANSVKKVITDRLIEESGDIRNMVRFPTEKRIITKAIEICSYGFKSHSKCHKIELVWGEYILYGKEE